MGLPSPVRLHSRLVLPPTLRFVSHGLPLLYDSWLTEGLDPGLLHLRRSVGWRVPRQFFTRPLHRLRGGRDLVVLDWLR